MGKEGSSFAKFHIAQISSHSISSPPSLASANSLPNNMVKVGAGSLYSPRHFHTMKDKQLPDSHRHHSPRPTDHRQLD